MNSFDVIKQVHLVVVILFLLLYLIKTILLLANKKESLMKFIKTFKVPEMIISFTFLGTGIYMLTQVPEINSLMIIKIVCVFASIPLAVIGFKKSNKILAVLSMLLLIGSYGLAEMSSKKKSSPVATSTSVDGKEIYTTYCIKCHGDDGKAQIMSATDLSLSQLSTFESFGLIHNGKNNMPAFADQLNEGQIKAVAEYIQALKK